jgi:hypothetical protein
MKPIVKILSFLKNGKNWITVIFPFLLFIVLIIMHFFSNDPQNPVSPFTRIFYASHTLNKEIVDIKTHNYNLINFITNSRTKSGEDHIGQSRTIYLGIIAVFLSLLFASNSTNKLPMLLGLLSLITLMYALDVHLKDIYWKRELSYKTTITHVEDLINSGKIDSIWYKVNTESLNAQLDVAGRWGNRTLRKFYRAIKPDGEQIWYFILPWFILYILTVNKIFLKFKTLKGIRRRNLESN